jgi:hypothetical protein
MKFVRKGSAMTLRPLLSLALLPLLAACAPSSVMMKDPKTNATFECKATDSFDPLQEANQLRECRKRYEAMGWTEVED